MQKKSKKSQKRLEKPNSWDKLNDVTPRKGQKTKNKKTTEQKTMAIIYAMEDGGYKTAKQVKQAYPAAAVVKRVTGGWAVFETLADYDVWRKQK